MSALAPDDPRHGTTNGYGNLGCRCEACRRAIREYMVPRNREWRHRTGRHKPREIWLAEVEPAHGTESRYSKGCRCATCRTAASAARRLRRARKTEAA